MSTVTVVVTAPPPVQGCLFDIGVSLTDVRELEESLMRSTRSSNTLKAYDHNWSLFRDWCLNAGRVPLPANSETIRLFTTWAVSVREPRYRINSVRLFLSAIAYHHRRAGHCSPVDSSVRALVTGAARKLRERPGGKLAISIEQLRTMVSQCGDDPLGRRDRALVLLGFATGWRRSELVALQVSDIEFVGRGLRVSLYGSKTDQEAKDVRMVGVRAGAALETCPVRSMRAWLKARGDFRGPLFLASDHGRSLTTNPMAGQSVARVVKRLLEQSGIDPAQYGGHSLRAGLVTAAGQNGATELSIMQRTGHKRFDTLRRYFRPREAFGGPDPLEGLL